MHRVDRAEAGCAGGRHHRADPAARQQRIEFSDVDAAGRVGADGSTVDAEDAAHPAVRVVRLGAVGNAKTGMRFPRDVQRFEVRDRAASGEMPEVLTVSEHPGKLADDLLFHRRRRRAAVKRVVVRVDQHGGEIAGYRRRMRRLQHLPGVSRVEERVVVGQPPC